AADPARPGSAGVDPLGPGAGGAGPRPWLPARQRPAARRAGALPVLRAGVRAGRGALRLWWRRPVAGAHGAGRARPPVHRGRGARAAPGPDLAPAGEPAPGGVPAGGTPRGSHRFVAVASLRAGQARRLNGSAGVPAGTGAPRAEHRTLNIEL